MTNITYIQLNRIRQSNFNIYYQCPKLCAKCNNPISYKQRYNKFCSSSCSVSFNNMVVLVQIEYINQNKNV